MDRPLSAVWAASRAGVRRRRVQAVSIALVVALSTATLVFGIGLLAASNSLFDDAFAKARGAHATVAFDSAEVTAAQAAATARASGVTAAAGPFQTAVLPGMHGPGPEGGGDGAVIAGRAGPGGPVDRLTITAGRWVRAPGEIVLRGTEAGPLRPGENMAPPGLPALKIVGFATSATDGGPYGWVSPAQIGAFHPSGLLMEYRFARAADASQVKESVTAATGGLPARGYDSYLTARQSFQENFNELIPFVTVFGALAMAVSVFLIGNVVSGAVVSGYRRIGVMKALGFTPAQVTAVYIAMIMTPALAGCAVGLAAGHLLAARTAASLAEGFELPSAGGAGAAPDAAAAGCVVALVVLAALLPALRAGRLPAVQAISAGTVSRRGRGRRVQRWLARTRLPVAAGLGLSLPVARPARTALTLAGLGAGVLAVTLGLGLHATVTKILTADAEGHTSVSVGVDPHGANTADLTEQQVYALLRAQPGTAHVMSFRPVSVRIPETSSALSAETYSGDYAPFLGDNIVRGRWFTGAGEIVTTEAFLRVNDMDVGDALTLRTNDEQVTVRIVGAFAHSDTGRLMLDAASLPGAAAGDIRRRPFAVIVEPGTDPSAYAARLNAAAPSTGLFAEPAEPDLTGGVVLNGLFLLFSLVICAAAALGVLNSVLLNARERSRDLGVLKAVGMAPRQVVLMMVTSMAALGAIGGAAGVPLGVLAHHGVVTLTGDLLGSGMAASWIHVYTWSLLVPPACAGLLVAVLGAWAPAVRAAATRTASVLRSE